MRETDIVIIGAGAAGLTAAIYAARAGKKVIIIEKLAAGGQINSTPMVENYSGFIQISGYELAEKMREQAEKCGAEIISDTVIKIVDGEKKSVKLAGGETLESKALVLACGANAKTLGLKNESELVGAGLSYCATCDGAFFRGKDVCVVGNTPHAAVDVKYLLPIARKVYWLGGETKTQDMAGAEILHGEITALSGSPLERVTIADNGDKMELAISGLFVAVGYAPQTKICEGLVKMTERGYILADENMETSAKGIFVAGDCREKKLRQIITACADGAIAGHNAARVR